MITMIINTFKVRGDEAELEIVRLYSAGLMLERTIVGKLPMPNKERSNSILKQEKIKAQPSFCLWISLGMLRMASKAARGMMNNRGICLMRSVICGVRRKVAAVSAT